jgi:hypothetical protein
MSETSLVAVNTKDFLNSQSYINDLISKKENCNKMIPRILNKITLCVYPTDPVVPDASRITGLDNYNLYGQAKFDINTVKLFSEGYLLLSAWCLTMVIGLTFLYLYIASREATGRQGHRSLCSVRLKQAIKHGTQSPHRLSLLDLQVAGIQGFANPHGPEK